MKKVILVLAVMLGFTTSVAMADPGPYDPQCADGNGGLFTPCQANNGFDVYNAINKVFVDLTGGGAGLTNNADADALQVGGANEFWQQLSGAPSSDFAFISLTANNSNTLGVYPAGSPAAASTFFTISFSAPDGLFPGAGSLANPYPGFINPLSAVPFGFSLFSNDPNPANTDYLWASEVAQNVDGIDHMLAYNLSALAGRTVYIKIDGNGDGDLNDPEDTIKEIVLGSDTYLIAWEDKHADLTSHDSDYNDTIYLVSNVRPVPEPMSMLLLGSGLAALAGTRRRKQS